MNFTGLLKGSDRIQGFIILGVIVGVLLAGIGIALTAISTGGLVAAVTLVGSFITFVFTVILVFYWFVRGDRL